SYAGIVTGIVVSMILAMLTFVCIERPFLLLRSRWIAAKKRKAASASTLAQPQPPPPIRRRRPRPWSHLCTRQQPHPERRRTAGVDTHPHFQALAHRPAAGTE